MPRTVCKVGEVMATAQTSFVNQNGRQRIIALAMKEILRSVQDDAEV